MAEDMGTSYDQSETSGDLSAASSAAGQEGSASGVDLGGTVEPTSDPTGMQDGDSDETSADISEEDEPEDGYEADSDDSSMAATDVPDSVEDKADENLSDDAGTDESITDDNDDAEAELADEDLSDQDVQGHDESQEEEANDNEDDGQYGSEMSTSSRGGTRYALRPIVMVVTSRTPFKVFRNSQKVGWGNNWRKALTISFKARNGDAITVITNGTSNHFGVSAFIQVGRHHRFVTGGRGGGAFKASSLRLLSGSARKRFMKAKKKLCFLKRPVSLPNGSGLRYAKNRDGRFLLSLGARYMWARRAKPTDVMWLRFVVGGEVCGRPKVSRSPRPTPSPSPKNVVGGARCACRVVRGRSKGECFEFRNSRFSEISNKVGACRERDCGLKYECVQPGRRSRILCVRRFARYEVRSIGIKSKGKCRNVPLKPAKPYYAPYS